MARIFDLKDIPQEILANVGGKARGLNRLIGFGYSVPRGFIITDIAEDESFEEAAKKYREEGYDSVSVRSSATLEDGDEFSAAGQFSTFLNVKGEQELKRAAADCVASLHNATAENYSKTFLNSKSGEMTVVVQEMVDARTAGVIFSQAPMRPGYVLVEAVPGIGENLVSGRMAAQQYLVKGKRVEQMPDGALLSLQEAIELGEGGSRAEELFGMPMDLEWDIGADNKIKWLQARPITIEESVTINELDCPLDASAAVNTTGNIGEVMPGAVTPLNLSTNMYALDWGVMETYRQIGCTDGAMPPYSYIASYANHMFFNMTNMYRACHTVYGSKKYTLDLSICGKVLEGMPDIEMKDLSFFPRMRNTLRFMKFIFSGEKAKRGMDKVVASIKFDLSADMHSLYAQILENFEKLKWTHFYHYCTSYYSGGQTNILTISLEKKYKDKNELQSTLAGCLTEIDDFESANVLRMMRSLSSHIVEEMPEAVDFSVEQLADYMENKASAKVREEYEAFMRKHGHRGIHEMEIRCPSWRSNKYSFFTSLLSVISSIHLDANASQRRSWRDYAEELLQGTSGLKRKMQMRLILNARKGVCYREYTKSKIVYSLNLFKEAYSQLAALMVKENMLPDADCIYFLRQEEVGELLKGNQSLVKRAIARRRLFPQQMELKFPYVTLGVPQPLVAGSANPDATVFHGTPVSRGIASGVARVVRDENDAAKLQKGEIMIAACTDIGWTPYYNSIAGLVTEIGSALSHGIVVAREYALPSVVNVPNVLQEVKTGDFVTIDGNRGTLYIDRRAS